MAACAGQYSQAAKWWGVRWQNVLLAPIKPSRPFPFFVILLPQGGEQNLSSGTLRIIVWTSYEVCTPRSRVLPGCFEPDEFRQGSGAVIPVRYPLPGTWGAVTHQAATGWARGGSEEVRPGSGESAPPNKPTSPKRSSCSSSASASASTKPCASRKSCCSRDEAAREATCTRVHPFEHPRSKSAPCAKRSSATSSCPCSTAALKAV
jgi:hypothetical protein